MIASVAGVLVLRDPSGIVIDTAGGTGYLLEVPLGVFERLPAAGERVQLYTELVVREEAWSLYGFDGVTERAVFRRLMGASGVGPRLALAILSALGPERTVRAIRDRDLAALASVSGIGKKKAERIALELGDRIDDLPVAAGAASGHPSSADAVRALVKLGYTPAASETAVRAALDGGTTQDTAVLVRRALSDLTRK
jgi:Holliday junction DNA helicase RuvA